MSEITERDPAPKRGFIKRAKKVIKALRKEGLFHSTALAALLEAGVRAQTANDPQAVLSALSTAISKLEVAECRAMVAAAKRQKGLLIGGIEGQALVREADEWFRDQGVVNPERFAAFMAPGLGNTRFN